MQKGRIYRGSGESGNWMLRYWQTVLDKNGQPMRRRACVKLCNFDHDHRTEASVRNLAAKYLAPVNAKATPESVQTVADFIEHIWLPDCQEHLRHSTNKLYRNIYKLIKPHLNGITLTDFRVPDTERILLSISKSKPTSARVIGREKRAHSSLKATKAILASAFKHARRTGLIDIDRDPIRDARLPQGLPVGNTHAYSLAEIKAVLKHLSGTPRTLIMCAAFSGLRISEVRGLKWEDLSDTEIKVQRAIVEKWEEKPKTQRSNAPVPLVSILKRELDEHRKRNPNTVWVFESSQGKPLYLRNLMHTDIWPAFAKAKIQWQGWHAFRRGVATNLSTQGAQDTMIRDILRHSNVAVTQGNYIRPVNPEAQKAMRKMEQEFNKQGD